MTRLIVTSAELLLLQRKAQDARRFEHRIARHPEIGDKIAMEVQRQTL